MRSWWKTYGPSFRWAAFRLTPTHTDRAYMPILLTQIIGGRRWSLSLARTGEPSPVEPIEIPYEVFETDMLAAFRTGANHDEWERCITHGADRTLSGLRAALRAAGISVAPAPPLRRLSQTGSDPAPMITGSKPESTS